MAGVQDPWGTKEVPVDQMGRWRIGPLTLHVARKGHEWRLAHEYADDPLTSGVEVEVPMPPHDLLGTETVRRFGVSNPSCRLTLTPQLADRAVVTRPEHPFVVPPGEASVVYVTAPLWVHVSYGQDEALLTEIPTFRLSDTWFGPPNKHGELAYATRTFCRTSVDELQIRPHRAHTRVIIENRSPQPLDFVEVSLPMPRLDLYRARTGAFWTQDVGLLRESGDDFAALRLDATRPGAAPEAKLVTRARQASESNLVVRAFTSLFAGMGG